MSKETPAQRGISQIINEFAYYKKELTMPVKNVMLVILSTIVAAFSSLTIASEQEDEHNQAILEFFRGDPAVGYEQPAPLLTNAKERRYLSLNGDWHYIVDEAGMSWRVITKNDYFDHEVTYPETGMNMLEHSFDKSKVLQVPGDWNSQVAQLDRYRSKVLYHQLVDIEVKEGERYYLYFGGANYTTDVFVNNKIVGRNTGGYIPFNFDITDFVNDGENTIIVRVDANLDETTIPTMRTSDFWKYGGLIRDVGLVTLPETYLSQYTVFLKELADKTVAGQIQLAGEHKAQQPVEVSIPALSLKQSLITDSKGQAKFEVAAANLQLWSPTSPTLYDVELKVNGERVSDKIGFRKVTTEGNRILLNGEVVQIRGISLHDESLLKAGMANTEADARASLQLVKELNANFVRLAHYPHNEYIIKLADEMGLMVWSETPIVSLIDWDNADTLASARHQVISNIHRDINRASIITWSISNESFPSSQARLDFLTELANAARIADPSDRPIASALVGNPQQDMKKIARVVLTNLLKNPDVPRETKGKIMQSMGLSPEKMRAMAARGGESNKPATIDMVIDDPLGEVIDIVGYNEYFGWYYSKQLARALKMDEGLIRTAMLNVMPNIRFSNSFGKPMLISEFGAGAKAGLRSKEAFVWSEEYQAKVYRAQLDMLDRSENVQGYSPWVLKDFRSHLRELNGIQNSFNRKGLVSETGEKKLAFDVLAEHYEAKHRSQ